MTKGKIPEFETERLYLREVTLADVESYEKNFADYEVIQHLSAQVPWPYPKGGVQDFLEAVVFPNQGVTRWSWGIFLQEKPDEVIGTIDLWRAGCPENRGFWLAKKHWGNGYMTEAVDPITDYAFDALGFETLYFSNAVGNKRSRRIKEKMGATFVSTRPVKFVSPEYKEAETWELTKDSWRKHRGENFLKGYQYIL